MRCSVPCHSSKQGLYGIGYIQAIRQSDPTVDSDLPTGGSVLQIMQYFQARTSTYGFLLRGILFGATFFS